MATHLENEQGLVYAARHGDEHAFSLLANQYRPNIYRLAFKITGSPEDAEDSVQEALLKAYCHLKDFEGSSRFYTWLARIAMNEGLMKLRKRRSDRQVSLEDASLLYPEGAIPLEIEDDSRDPEERYAGIELQTAIQKALSTISPNLGQAWWLRNVEGFGVRQISKSLSLSAPAVKSRLLRARRVLSRRLRNLRNWQTRRRTTKIAHRGFAGR